MFELYDPMFLLMNFIIKKKKEIKDRLEGEVKAVSRIYYFLLFVNYCMNKY